MATLSESSKFVLTVGVFCLSLASVSANAPCKEWPLLANYNITSKEFTCRGAIVAFRLCRLSAFTHIGLTLWRRGKGVLGSRVEYASGGFDILHRELAYDRGDQLDYMVSYYYAANDNEGIGCHIPLAFTTTYGYNCTDYKPKLYLKVTEDCFQDINETVTREGNGTELDGESTNTPSTTTTLTTSSGSMNTTTVSSGNVTEATTSATTSPPTPPGSSTTSYTKPHPSVKAEENSTTAGSEATTAANDSIVSQAQNISSSCPPEMADRVSNVTQVIFGSSKGIVFTTMLTAIVILLVAIVLETVVCILVCLLCWRRARRKREGDGDSNKPFKIGYKRTEYDIALLEMNDPTASN